MYHEVINIVCFQTFPVKQIKRFAQKIYVFRGPCGKCIFSHNFTDRTKLITLFHFQRQVGAQRKISHFSNYGKIKIKCTKIYKKNFFKILCFYAIVCGFGLFLSENNLIIIFLETAALVGNKIPCKMMHVSTIQVKNCGRRYIFCSQKLTFQEKENTHQYGLCVKYIR